MKPIFTHETPLERLQRRLEQDELRRDRKPVTLPVFWSIRSDQILEGVVQ